MDRRLIALVAVVFGWASFAVWPGSTKQDLHAVHGGRRSGQDAVTLPTKLNHSLTIFRNILTEG